jgi:hypothetical protein
MLGRYVFSSECSYWMYSSSAGRKFFRSNVLDVSIEVANMVAACAAAVADIVRCLGGGEELAGGVNAMSSQTLQLPQNIIYKKGEEKERAKGMKTRA